MGYFTTVVAIVLAGAAWGGYIFSILWKWFVVTTFQVSPISVPAAIGITLMVKYMTLGDIMAFYERNVEPDTDEDAESKSLIALATMAALLPVAVLGMGWMVSLFL